MTACGESRHDDATTGCAHRHELLGRGRVNAERRVEHRLGRAGLHRHREALDRLAGVGADHVQADDAVVGVVDDELHQGALAAPRQRVAQRLEVGAIDADLLEAARARRASDRPIVPMFGWVNTAVGMCR